MGRRSTLGTDRRTRVAAGLVAYFVLLWLLWPTVVVAPLRLLVVLLHEISHGLAAVATGGTIREIVVTADEAGWCDCPGGNAFLTLSAGYLGSVAWGAGMVAAATAGRRTARVALAAIGLLLAAVALLHVRTVVTFLLSIGFGAGLLVASRRLSGSGASWTLAVLGLTSCLYAPLDLRGDVLARPGAPSDASALAGLTGVPSLVWGLIWTAVALAAAAWAVRRAWRRL